MPIFDGALGWIDRNIAEFNPFLNGREFEIRHGQKLAELATVSYLLAGDSRLRGDPRIERIQDLLVLVAGLPEFRDRAVRFPAEFVLVSDVYAALRKQDREDAELRSLLVDLVDSGWLHATERLPHRMMDIRLSLDWCDIECDLPPLPALIGSSILSKRPPCLIMDERAAYAVTHVVMFATGFGTRAPDLEALGGADYLRRTLSGLVYGACRHHHWDLLGELLFCWDSLGLGPTGPISAAWDTFALQQADDGSFPGPESALKLWARQIGVDDVFGPAVPDGLKSQLEFAYRYHTTLVAIMAAQIHEPRLRPPPAELSVESFELPSSTSPPSLSVAGSHWHRAETTRSWLKAIRGREHGDVPDALGYAELGLWLLDAPGSRPVRPANVPGARGAPAKSPRPGPDDLAPGLPPVIVRLMAGVLDSEGGARFAEHMAWVAALARGVQRVDPEVDPRIGEVLVLLHLYGLAREVPEPITSRILTGMAEALRPEGPGSDYDNVVAAVNAATSFGRITLDAQGLTSALSETLTTFAFCAFRDYDVIRAARALRAANYLRPLRRSDRLTACRFLDGQFGPQGFAGAFGPEIAALGPNRRYQLTELRLSFTVEALWTLAEVSATGWRAVGALAEVASERSRRE